MSKNAIFIKDGYATIALVGGETITTTLLRHDRYVRIDDGRQYPQLCVNAARRGDTLIYRDDERLARDCNAKLYKSGKAFLAAAAKLADEAAYAATDDRD
jgi:hypothetical protein